jgi:maleate isomerase
MAMTEKIEEAASLVADAAVNLIVFHCTAVSTFDLKLEQSIRQRIEKTTATKTVLTSDAIVAGLRKLGAKKIVMLSPYTESTNEREKSFFEAYGFEVLGCAGLGRTTAPEMMSITPLQWIDFALANRNDDVDAYLISCTTVKSSETAGHLEELLGKPVVTSNTAMIWFCLRELGITDSIPSFGSLLLSH